MAVSRVGIENGMFGTYSVTKDGNEVFDPKGRAPKISSIIQYEESDEIIFVITYLYNNIRKKIEIPRSHLNKREIIAYGSKGLDAFDYTANCLIQVLIQLEDEYLKNNGGLIKHYHKKMGWHNVQYDKSNYLVYKHYEFKTPFTSKYKGKYDIKPKGDLQEWCNIVKSHVIGHAPMESIVAIGLSSVLVGYLKDDFDYENLFIHLVGDSSSGKTTAAALAISTCGNPKMSSDSLLKSWASTANAIMTTKMGNYGLTVGMDELSMYQGQDLTDLVYRLCSGTEKDRLTKDCKMKETESFKTTIISTGEVSLLSKCCNNTGLKMRVIELKAPWTTSADNAEAIKSGVMDAYGTAAQELAIRISEKDKIDIIARVQHYRSLYMERSKVKELVQRISTKYALILTTAELANEVFDFGLNIDNILNFFIDNEYQNMEVRDLGLDFYEKFKSWVFSNKHHFAIKRPTAGRIAGTSKSNEIKVETYGRIDYLNSGKLINGKKLICQVNIRKEPLKKFGEKFNFQDIKNVLFKLRDKGLLDYEKDHLDRKRKLDTDVAERVYVINIVEDSEDKDDVLEQSEGKTGNSNRRVGIIKKAKNVLED